MLTTHLLGGGHQHPHTQRRAKSRVTRQKSQNWKGRARVQTPVRLTPTLTPFPAHLRRKPILSKQQKRSTHDDGPVAIAEEMSVPPQGAVQTADMFLRPAQKSGKRAQDEGGVGTSPEGQSELHVCQDYFKKPRSAGRRLLEPDKPGNRVDCSRPCKWEDYREKTKLCWEFVFIFLSLVKPRAFFYQKLSAL